jgi:tetratricopeptide (TPR) repeat protein
LLRIGVPRRLLKRSCGAGLALAALVVCAWVPVGAAEPAPRAVTERLRSAAAAHPDDPALAWAWIAELARTDARAALDALGRFAARWPRQRPDLERTRGRLHYALGEDAAALEALDRAVGERPGDPDAHLVRGLVLRRLGHRVEADRAFETAGRLAPELRVESLVLRAVDAIAEGEADRGRDLLEQALELDPAPEMERRIRTLLRRLETAPRESALRLTLAGEVRHDSNPRREEQDLPNDPDSDWVAAWDAGATWKPLRGPNGSLALGYRYFQLEHEHADEEDFLSNRVFTLLSRDLGPRVGVRLLADVGQDLVDDDRYRWSAGARPSVYAALGSHLGTSEIAARVRYLAYYDPPDTSSRELDGTEWGGEWHHVVTLPLLPDTKLWLDFGASRYDTQARRDAAGFEGAYDRNRIEGAISLDFPLPFAVRGLVAVDGVWDYYRHRNVIDGDARAPFGLPARKREDEIGSLSVGMRRAITRWAELSVLWRGTDNSSNVELYDYHRNVALARLQFVFE